MNHTALFLPALLAGLPTIATAMPIPAENVRIDGMSITILPEKQTVRIAPLPVQTCQAEGALKVEKPGWGAGFYLPRSAWVFRSLKLDSLVVTLADPPGTRLVEGTDYVLDPDWGTIGALAESKIAPGTRLRFEYQVTESRLDLVERRADGRIAVVQGKEERAVPLLPVPTPGSTPLLGIYLAPNTTQLTPENVNRIDPAYRGVPPVRGGEYLSPIRQKLTEGGPLTIAFFGDSITAQTDPKGGSFVDRFARYLQAKYPQRKITVTPKETVVPPAPGQIVVVKAGVGGDNTVAGLRRIEKDVLAHKPDLVVVMFGVNDENAPRPGGPNGVPPERYRENLAAIVARVRAAGGDVLLMTTSMKNLGWEHTAGNLDQYAAAVRALAEEKKLCLVDNFAAWQEIPRSGYHYMVYLSTCINHPNELGHELFCEGLKAAFEGK